MRHSTKIEVRIVNAFTDNGKGGNPAGVVTEADFLTNSQKQKVAALAGLSETAFVSWSEIAAYKLEFFTPTRQIPHCGHATVATFSYLRQAGKITAGHTSKETIDGIREIMITDGKAFMEQLAPKYADPDGGTGEILAALGISEGHLAPQSPVKIVNTGNSFAIIPLKSITDLQSLTPDFEAITAITEAHGLIGFYAFAFAEGNDGFDATSRMFAPAYGINEESATGMAAGPLASYLYDVAGIRKDTITIQQGAYMDMPSPSRIEVALTIENGSIKKLLAGGTANVMKTLVIELD